MSEKYLKVKGSELVRDTYNMSIVNKDKNELEAYMNKRKFLSEQKREINTIKEEVGNLKSDISEIKQLLLQLTKG